MNVRVDHQYIFDAATNIRVYIIIDFERFIVLMINCAFSRTVSQILTCDFMACILPGLNGLYGIKCQESINQS